MAQSQRLVLAAALAVLVATPALAGVTCPGIGEVGIVRPGLSNRIIGFRGGPVGTAKDIMLDVRRFRFIHGRLHYRGQRCTKEKRSLDSD